MKYLHLLISLVTVWVLSACSSPNIDESIIFESGEDGYHTYRIPSLLTTSSGTVLAFCEGRKNNRSDSGDIDLLVKRSEDGGQTWSALQLVWDDGENTCGNPCPVVDKTTGRIVMLMTWNRGLDNGKALHAGTATDTRRVFQTHSDDDGRTWSQAVEITDQAKEPSWWWYATGPGVGIQLENGLHTGRLVIPANHTAPGYYGAHSVYSDDGGKSWKLGNIIRPTVNESQVVELSDGRLMMNMRSQGVSNTPRPRNGYRSISFSSDGGATWSDPVFDDELGDPVCQARIIRYDQERIIFSNPNPPTSPERGDRIRMTVRVSQDDGKTWPDELLIHEGSSAYSCLTRLPNGEIGLLYEKDKDIAFARIPIEMFD